MPRKKSSAMSVGNGSLDSGDVTAGSFGRDPRKLSRECSKSSNSVTGGSLAGGGGGGARRGSGGRSDSHATEASAFGQGYLATTADVVVGAADIDMLLRRGIGQTATGARSDSGFAYHRNSNSHAGTAVSERRDSGDVTHSHASQQSRSSHNSGQTHRERKATDGTLDSGLTPSSLGRWQFDKQYSLKSNSQSEQAQRQDSLLDTVDEMTERVDGDTLRNNSGEVTLMSTKADPNANAEPLKNARTVSTTLPSQPSMLHSSSSASAVSAVTVLSGAPSAVTVSQLQPGVGVVIAAVQEHEPQPITGATGFRSEGGVTGKHDSS